MMTDPTPFFAKSANKSDGEHYAGNASCSDHSPAARNMVSTCAENAPVHPASAAVPSEEEMLAAAMRAFEPLSSVLRYREKDGWHACDVMAMRAAISAVLALFAPVLAEKERLGGIADAYAACESVARKRVENIAPALEEALPDPRLMSRETWLTHKSRAPIMAVDMLEHAKLKAMEARALDAEAAMATEREQGFREGVDKVCDTKRWTTEMSHAWHRAVPDVPKAFADLAAAIHAQDGSNVG